MVSPRSCFPRLVLGGRAAGRLRSSDRRRLAHPLPRPLARRPRRRDTGLWNRSLSARQWRALCLAGGGAARGAPGSRRPGRVAAGETRRGRGRRRPMQGVGARPARSALPAPGRCRKRQGDRAGGLGPRSGGAGGSAREALGGRNRRWPGSGRALGARARGAGSRTMARPWTGRAPDVGEPSLGAAAVAGLGGRHPGLHG